ncbi:uncharacterized protein LOC106466156 [Limulus polyphemus]|uniref:Uncharacterized protein LOC106466156 n=1 Tax=Limulus polyphemus TaxID=6850 RepID=A0ABM1BH24_LIMPO|nr:uncharacterized protein LOC106466156 [Limulus polyphemus]
MSNWRKRATSLNIVLSLFLQLQKTEGKQQCRDPYRGNLIICPGNEYFCCGDQCCNVPPTKVAPLYSAWYFWVAIFIVGCLTVSMAIACILCCKKNRKDVLIRLAQSVPNAVLRTAQDSHGIIQPDVTFYQRPPIKEECATVSTTRSAPLRLTTPIRPLTPAYQPSQPITITTVRAATSCTDLTLPPGYVMSRDSHKCH